MCGWKNAKDIGTAIRKSILVSFLPYLDDVLGSHPYMVLHFFKCLLHLPLHLYTWQSIIHYITPPYTHS